MSVAPASASTAARIPSTTEGSASMTPPLMLGDGGLAQYWWLVVIVVVAAAALWLFLRHNSRNA
jgi:hypothetical protein